MPDLLDRIRAEMSTRLAELRPLVDEHRRLEAALEALYGPKQIMKAIGWKYLTTWHQRMSRSLMAS